MRGYVSRADPAPYVESSVTSERLRNLPREVQPDFPIEILSHHGSTCLCKHDHSEYLILFDAANEATDADNAATGNSLESCLCRHVFPFVSRSTEFPQIGLGGNEPLISQKKVKGWRNVRFVPFPLQTRMGFVVVDRGSDG